MQEPGGRFKIIKLREKSLPGDVGENPGDLGPGDMLPAPVGDHRILLWMGENIPMFPYCINAADDSMSQPMIALKFLLSGLEVLKQAWRGAPYSKSVQRFVDYRKSIL